MYKYKSKRGEVIMPGEKPAQNVEQQEQRREIDEKIRSAFRTLELKGYIVRGTLLRDGQEVVVDHLLAWTNPKEEPQQGKDYGTSEHLLHKIRVKPDGRHFYLEDVPATPESRPRLHELLKFEPGSEIGSEEIQEVNALEELDVVIS